MLRARWLLWGMANLKSFSWYHFQLFLWPLNWCKCRIAFLSLIHFVTKLDDYWLWIAWKLVNSLLQKAPINFYLMANNTGHNLRVKFGENWNCLLAVFLATRLSVACLYISLVAGVEHCLMRKKERKLTNSPCKLLWKVNCYSFTKASHQQKLVKFR